MSSIAGSLSVMLSKFLKGIQTTIVGSHLPIRAVPHYFLSFSRHGFSLSKFPTPRLDLR